jgi:hypothetical protein
VIHYRDQSEPDERVVVGECPSCSAALVGSEYEVELDEGYGWSNAIRLWPEPKRVIARSIPEIVEVSLDEAEKCFSAAAYSACAVMCGRALEGICVHFKINETLAVGLKELLDKEIIDKRLFAWGDELRKFRNLGAHATADRVLQEDARDVLDFVHSIVQYVFVLNEQFERFMKRRPAKP